MKQIILNYLGIFMVPALFGSAIRFLFRCAKKGYWVSIGLCVVSGIGWIAANVIPNHGSELYGILAYMMISASVGSLISGLISTCERRS